VCGQFIGPRRVAGELISSSAVVLDCDKPGATRESLLAALDALGCAYLAATSTSHGVDGQARYRVVLPLAQPASPEQYKVLWANLAARLPGVDPGAKDPTRLNYLPKVPRGASGHEVIVRDDRPWLTELAAIPAPAPSQLGAAFLPPRGAVAAENDALIIQRQPVTRTELTRALADYAKFDVSDYDSWREVGAIIHHETGGGDDGLELFIEYSRCLSGFYAGAEAGEKGCVRKWASFGRSGAKPVTFGTLFYKLKTLRATRDLSTPQNPQKKYCVGELSRTEETAARCAKCVQE
jgi:hypothetical protein